MDSNWNQLWTHTGNTGHYPWPYDFDGDGRDEVMCGNDLLDHDGSMMWHTDMPDHADGIWVADVDQDPSNGMEIVWGGSDTTVFRWTRYWGENTRRQMPFPGGIPDRQTRL